MDKDLAMQSAAIIRLAAKDFQGEEVVSRNDPGMGSMEIEVVNKNILAQPFFSALQLGIEALNVRAAPPQGWIEEIAGLVNKASAKEEEVEWSGVIDWLSLQDEKITKERVLNYLRENGVRVEEVLYEAQDATEVQNVETGHTEAWTGELPNNLAGGSESGQPKTTKYDKWTLPGGQKYRELLITLPDARDGISKARSDLEGRQVGAQAEYKHRHWEQSNVIAHIRLKDRQDEHGKRVLFVEELQGDWAADAKRYGFAADPQQNTVQTRVPPAPFVSKLESWLSLAIKRTISYAVENGYEAVAFVNGEATAERYELKKVAGQLFYRWNGNWTYDIELLTSDNESVFAADKMSLKDLEKIVGKQLSRDAYDGEGESCGERGWRVISGIKVEYGGDGLISMYDKVIPNVVNRVLSKLGEPRLSAINVLVNADQSLDPTGGTPQVDQKQHATSQSGGVLREFRGFRVTDALKKKVVNGLPLFQSKGDDKRGYIAFDDRRRFTISILPGADRSTFLHEAAHLYLEILADLACKPDAREEIKKDFSDVLEYLGLKSREDLTLSGKTPGSEQYGIAEAAHEKFARANEEYLCHDAVPNQSLRPMFERFREWLQEIYRGVRIQPDVSQSVKRVLDVIYGGNPKTSAGLNIAKDDQSIKESVLEKLRVAGMNEDLATDYSSVFAAAIGNLARRAGLSPKSVFDEYQIHVGMSYGSAINSESNREHGVKKFRPW